MIQVKVQLFGILADHLSGEEKGKATLKIEESSTFKDLMDKIGVRRKVTFAVNGEHDLEETQVLNDGDEVLVFSSVSGG